MFYLLRANLAGILQTLSPLVFTTTLQNKYYYLRFIDETKVHRGQGPCDKSSS